MITQDLPLFVVACIMCLSTCLCGKNNYGQLFDHSPKMCADIEKDCSFKSGKLLGTNCKRNRLRFMARCRKLTQEKHKEPECNPRCRNFLLKLETGTKGNDDIFNCDCEDDMGCIVLRKRILRCMHQTLKNKTSCVDALQDCERNNTCFTLYKDWFSDCNGMRHGFYCSDQCVRASNRLYSNTLGKRLETCECAGGFEEEKFCIITRTHWKQLCTSKKATNITITPVISPRETINQQLETFDRRNRKSHSKSVAIGLNIEDRMELFLMLIAALCYTLM